MICRDRLPMFLAFGKSEISSLIRSVLRAVQCARGEDDVGDMCLDEFSRAGLAKALNNSTKIFLADEADVSFVDAGLFSAFSRASSETTCRRRIDSICSPMCFDRL